MIAADQSLIHFERLSMSTLSAFSFHQSISVELKIRYSDRSQKIFYQNILSHLFLHIRRCSSMKEKN